MLSLLLHYI
uniref:Uncharacterized protein n=1 Tax=Zea mays TaxID=4577 RepID=C0PLG8_MAIZE|nr:unknown [Zea mays]